MLVCLAAVIILWPFGMQAVSDGATFQKASKVHGEDITLFESMKTLDTVDEKLVEWNLMETTSEYQSLKQVAENRSAGQYGAFMTRLVLCCVAIVLFVACVVLLKKTRYLLLVIGALVMVFPFYWMIASSFKTAAEMNRFPPSMGPDSWTNFSNYVTAWDTAPFATYFFNSIFVCVCSVGIVMFTTILAAFAFMTGRSRFLTRNLLPKLENILRAHLSEKFLSRRRLRLNLASL